MSLILASASRQRLVLLRQIGFEPDHVLPTEIDESPIKGELPGLTSQRLARAKLEAAERTHDCACILAADTIASCGRRLLGKPEDIIQAEACLRLLSGRAHMVCTCVAVRAADGRIGQRRVMARVRFKRLSEADITEYLQSGEWRGRAGGYAIQGLAGRFVLSVNGSYGAIAGLPLYEAHALLIGAGLRSKKG